VGSAKLFDEAYVSHKDWPARADFALNKAQRLEDLDAFALGSPEVIGYCEKHILDNSDSLFKDIPDGTVFDLGGVHIEAIAVPGHSDGSMAFYNREDKYVFSGDAINTDVHLKKMTKQSFAQYIDTLQNFLKRVEDDVKIYPAHLPLTMNTEIVRNLIAVCEDIVTGKTEGDPPGETIFTKRNNNPAIRMHYVGNTCVVYNEELARG
jgi:glyoxylase-like metal-dependent hydrolase (beta-lactamase superfamily II)